MERRVEQESAALRDEVRAMHREFAANVAQVVGEQVALRAAELEPVVEARVVETETTMAEFVSAISMMCRQTADRNKQERAEAAEPPAVEPQPEPALPPGSWRIQVASSFLFAVAAAAS